VGKWILANECLLKFDFSFLLDRALSLTFWKKTKGDGILMSYFPGPGSLKFALGLRMDGIREENGERIYRLNPQGGMFWRMGKIVSMEIFYEPRISSSSFTELYLDREYVEMVPQVKSEKNFFSLSERLNFSLAKNVQVTLLFSQQGWNDYLNWEDNDGDGLLEANNEGEIFKKNFTTYLEWSWGRYFQQLFHLRLLERNAPISYEPSLLGEERVTLFAGSPFQIILWAKYVGGRKSRRFGEMKDYFLLSSQIIRKIGNYWTFSFWVENLTNQRYEVYRGYPGPPLKGVLGIKLAF